jgi:hypothetical protein
MTDLSKIFYPIYGETKLKMDFLRSKNHRQLLIDDEKRKDDVRWARGEFENLKMKRV